MSNFEEMLTCPGCARPVTPGATRCPGCGQPLTGPGSPGPAASGADLSIDDLLSRSGVAERARPVSPARPAPAASAFTTGGPPEENKAEPPAPANPPALPAWQPLPAGSKDALSVYTYQEKYGEPPQPPPAGPQYGFERGYLFYTTELEELVLLELASFTRRAGAALADVIIALVPCLAIYLATKFVLLQLITSQALEQARSKMLELNYDGASKAVVAGLEEGLTAFNTLSVSSIVFLLIFILVPFCYHFLLTGLTAQTLGDRLFSLRVVREKGGFVGTGPAFLRTVYGSLPQLLAVLLLALPLGLLAVVPAVLLLAGMLAGLATARSDSHHQGWHDKLARTYVVTTRKARPGEK